MVGTLFGYLKLIDIDFLRFLRFLRPLPSDKDILDDFPKNSDHFPKISEDSPKLGRRPREPSIPNNLRNFAKDF